MFVNKKQHTNYLTGFVALLISLSTNASGGNSVVDAEQAQLSEFYLAHEAKLESRESDFGTSRYHLGMSRSPRMPKGLGITRDREHVFVTNFDALVWNGKKTGGVAVLPMPNSDGEVESGYQVIPSSWSNNGYMSGNAEILVHPDGKRVFASRIEGTHKEGRYGSIAVFDPESLILKKEILLKTTIGGKTLGGNGAKFMHIIPRRGDRPELLMVANWHSHNISVIDLDREIAIDHVSLKNNKRTDNYYNISPRGMAYWPEEDLLIVGGYEDGSLYILNLALYGPESGISQIHQIPAFTPRTAEFPRNPGLKPRHLIRDSQSEFIYVAMQRGDAIARINLDRLKVYLARVTPNREKNPTSVAADGTAAWKDILESWPASNKNFAYFLRTQRYPADHPTLPSQLSTGGYPEGHGHPNTMALDPSGNFLYVSNRTTTNYSGSPNRRYVGKVDAIDLNTGELAFSFVAGLEATSLDICSEGKILVSGGFKDRSIHFFDVEKFKNEYRFYNENQSFPLEE